MIESIIFYAFSFILVVSALLVVTARQLVHSVLFLVLAFFTAAGLFVMLGAEFLAMLMVIVYVGAVAVLFLFAVMMLDINMPTVKKKVRMSFFVGIIVGGILIAEFVAIFATWKQPDDVEGAVVHPIVDGISNTNALGQILYTDYAYPFQISGMILFVAMIGAIVLSMRKRPEIRRQNIARQVSMTREEAIEIIDVETGKGV